MPYYEDGSSVIYCGKCEDVLPDLGDASVNMVLADLPYGTSYCAWDTEIDLPLMWGQLDRLVKGTGAMVFTSVQPFTTALISSRYAWFRYEWVWDKGNASNFANAKKQPLKQHETVTVFSKGQSPYFPIKAEGKPNHAQGKGRRNESPLRKVDERGPDDLTGMKYPKSILFFPKHSSQSKHHPTEKPTSLLSYLIQTYTTPDDVILDPTMGSGSTLVAAKLTGRRAIGIETDERYCATAVGRLQTLSPQTLPLPP